MPWDSSRVVPWRRLIREAVVFGALMAVVFAVFVQGDAGVGSYLGLLLGLVVYVLLMAGLAKFGYSRKTLADLRAERAAIAASTTTETAAPPSRSKPAPTRRTGGGQQRSAAKRRR